MGANQIMETTVYIMYGMGGAAFDPAGGERTLVKLLNDIGIKTAQSPYQYSDIQKIVDAIHADKSDKIIIGGDSLGACNTPYAAQYCGRHVDYIFGFQPSIYGAHVPVTPNVKEAHCIYNPNFIETFGLGAYKWELAPGNKQTRLLITEHHAPHPDDWGWSQQLVLHEIKRIAGK